MSEIVIVDNLLQIDKEQWDLCYAECVERYDYLLAVQHAGIQGFSYAYVTLWEDELLLACLPLFVMDYALDTTLQGAGKKITAAIAKAFPSLLTIKLACAGSPCTETVVVGFHPSISATQKPPILKMLLVECEHYAAATGCKLLGIKDIPQQDSLLWQAALNQQKYVGIAGLPTAYLDIDFEKMDDYMARLSHASRKDMRRKLRHCADIEIRIATTIDDVMPHVMRLYHETKNRSDWQFEELTEHYFRGVLEQMKDRSFCTLYYLHGTLLAANLMVHSDQTLIDKFFCMDGELGRRYNLYFLSWFTNIQYCLDYGFTRYQSGQEGYETKLRLGSSLSHNMMYFKHRNTLAHTVLKWISPLFATDETFVEAA